MIIKSFLPNPAGKDTEGEEVVLFNESSDVVGLSSWWIEDAAGKKYFLSGTLAPSEELILPYSKTKIPLNNNSETVYLYGAQGNLVDELSYVGSVKEEVVISRSEATDGIYKKAELLESWPELSGVINNHSQLPSSFLIMFFIAAILAGVSVYAYKKLYTDEELR